MKKNSCLFAFLFILLFGACSSRTSTANLAPDEHTLSTSRHNTEEVAPTSSCKRDEDCMLTNKGCCACSASGTRIAISIADEKAYAAKVKSDCVGIVCAQFVNTFDPSCAKDAKAECNKDTALCQLAEPSGQ